MQASTDLETPVRLINDCTYLAGEIRLMALGIGHLGFVEINSVLEETSRTMDSCGMQWRTRYLVINMPVTIPHFRKIFELVYIKEPRLPKDLL